MRKFILSAIILMSSSIAFAHGGGTDTFGCHLNNALSDGDKGRYHCHKGCYNGQSFTTMTLGREHINRNGNKTKNECNGKVAKK